MNTNIVSRTLAVIGILALSVTAVDAGRGQGGPSVSVFKCYGINGANSDRIITITDQFGPQSDVAVGAAVLVCTPAIADKRTLDPDFDTVPGAADHLKCYNISAPGPRERVRLVDPFDGGSGVNDGETVRVSGAHYVCTFGDKHVLP